jgi:MoaA/NifB/PqqE/SkfB family radical SAM enzyme
MKTRIENSGLHMFDRENGLHILMDEYEFPKELISLSPRTVSIALTNRCNLDCYYCYAPKNNNTLPIQFIKDVAVKLDELGTLELTFGGGEPFIYPEIIDLIQWLWQNTKLGINITTNGLLLNSDIINTIKDKVSSLRFSIDGLEPKYSAVKRHVLSELIKKINLLKGFIPFGINIITNPNSIIDVEKVIELSIELGAIDVLLIPEHKNGKFLLQDGDWLQLENIVTKYQKRIQVNITYDASSFINTNYLETEVKKEFLFAHISADQKIKLRSYDIGGVYVDNPLNIDEYLQFLYQN